MKFDDFIQEFQELEPEERLELLIELANELPELSEARRSAPFPEQCRVQECQTPVHLWVDVGGDRVRIEADVPVKSPTVRGLVSVVVQSLDRSSPMDVAAFPDDVLSALGLRDVLGMTRQQGMRGVVARIKREVAARRETGGG